MHRRSVQQNMRLQSVVNLLQSNETTRRKKNSSNETIDNMRHCGGDFAFLLKMIVYEMQHSSTENRSSLFIALKRQKKSPDLTAL